MPTTIPDLWPEEISVDVPTPRMILNVQATRLTARTAGILEAEIDLREDDQTDRLVLQVVAPALNNAVEQILIVESEHGKAYPAKVFASCYESKGSKSPLFAVPTPHFGSAGDPPGGKFAAGHKELLTIVGEVLNSPEAKSTTLSLIAKSNEVRGSHSDASADEESSEARR